MVEHCDFTEQASVDPRRRDDPARPRRAAGRRQAGRRRRQGVARCLPRGGGVQGPRRRSRRGWPRTPGTCGSTSRGWPGRSTGGPSSRHPSSSCCSCLATRSSRRRWSSDPTLLEDAMAERVLIATPTTLMAMLRTVAYSWQQEALTAHARSVFEIGRELYHRLGTLGGHVDKLGKTLGRAVDDYNKTVGSLERSVLVQARQDGRAAGDRRRPAVPVAGRDRAPPARCRRAAHRHRGAPGRCARCADRAPACPAGPRGSAALPWPGELHDRHRFLARHRAGQAVPAGRAATAGPVVRAQPLALSAHRSGATAPDDGAILPAGRGARTSCWHGCAGTTGSPGSAVAVSRRAGAGPWRRRRLVARRLVRDLRRRCVLRAREPRRAPPPSRRALASAAVLPPLLFIGAVTFLAWAQRRQRGDARDRASTSARRSRCLAPLLFVTTAATVAVVLARAAVRLARR